MGYNPFYNIENPQLMGYEYAWIRFIKHNEINHAIISKDIANSWRRCHNGGLSFDTASEKAAKSEKGDFITEFLVGNGGSIIKDIFKNLDSDCFYGIITDREGKKLFGLGNESDAFSGRLKEISEIPSFAEEKVGTNCFSVVAEIKKPYSVAGAQHYFEFFHRFAGYAAPIFNIDNEIIGMVGFYTMAEQMDDYIISFVVAVERAIENSLKWLNSREIVEKQREEKQYILDTVSDGVAYVDVDGKIVHGNRKLFELFGVKSESVVGGDISNLSTTPPVDELKKYPFSSIYSSCDNKISIVNSRGESRQSFLNKYKIMEYGSQENNEVWVFTVYSDIKKLAKKLSAGNTSRFTFDDIKSNSKAMKIVIELAKKASSFEAGTIIEGDSGTGKEMLAQAIHSYGPRKDGPFIAVDCGALPSGLLESELFGYEEGAFTGAKRGGKKGRFELANKGVLFLDEITNMPYDVQAKLLRALQERKIVPIGGAEPVSLDVQVIAATNKDIVAEIEQGNFRRDLFYRLNLIHIKIPSLTERENDLQLFLKYFMHKYNPKGDMRLSKEAVDILSSYEWPGNVRQLENVIERMVIISNAKTIGRESIPDEILRSVSSQEKINEFDLEEKTLNDICSFYVKKTAEKYGGNIKKAAEVLGISRVTVYKYLNGGHKS
ncbi:PAS domain S-box-containing protein [Oscillibacter sp. PC13]|uniref:sigma-54 interaction domain-containing protein n=1 Tax=Oscillibacter sp. PC13 TaxID=1855299 RepID=UPI0008EF61B2|nr:sigma 54-interacting transcriptional regulator [Oscillibacter sp. PC13]SFP51750.1 PAS domain S-box-containing protein [Oscillibacter sp. PC13]